MACPQLDANFREERIHLGESVLNNTQHYLRTKKVFIISNSKLARHPGIFRLIFLSECVHVLVCVCVCLYTCHLHVGAYRQQKRMLVSLELGFRQF